MLSVACSHQKQRLEQTIIKGEELALFHERNVLEGEKKNRGRNERERERVDDLTRYITGPNVTPDNPLEVINTRVSSIMLLDRGRHGRSTVT